MYIFSASVSKAKIGLIIAMLLVFISAAIFLTNYLSERKTAENSQEYKIINTQEGRIKFINDLGWEVDPKKYSASETSLIPQKSDALFKEYEKLQRSQGMSLMDYRGKSLSKYTYRVLNYKEPKRTVYINIFIDNDRVVAGDINDPDFKSGFVKSLLPR